MSDLYAERVAAAGADWSDCLISRCGPWLTRCSHLRSHLQEGGPGCRGRNADLWPRRRARPHFPLQHLRAQQREEMFMCSSEVKLTHCIFPVAWHYGKKSTGIHSKLFHAFVKQCCCCFCDTRTQENVQMNIDDWMRLSMFTYVKLICCYFILLFQ